MATRARATATRATAEGSRSANGEGGYGANGEAGYGGNGSAARNGGGSRRGEVSRYGDQSRSSDASRSSGTSQYGDPSQYGEPGRGRRSRAYRVDSDNGYESGGRRSDGYARNGDYGSNGDRGASDDDAENRYGAEGRRSSRHGTNGDAEYGRTRRSGGRSYRHGGRSASYRSGTGLVEGGPAALPDADGGGYGGPYGPDGPYGPGGPGGPYGPGGPGGPGRGGGGGGRGSGGGRRGPRGLADPERRRTQPPGGFWQRQWRASWWRHWTLRKAALVVSCMALATVLILIAGFFYIYSTVQLPIKTLSAPLVQSSVVYFNDGKTEVGCFCTTNRTVLTSTDLASNKYLEQAFFAAEDRHYLTEGGISLTGTARAILVDLTGKGYQGGSTITEQFVKTYFDPSGLGNLTYKDKIKEIVDAIKLAKLKDKQWILTHYLNAIYLGSGAYGVEAAAQTYFGLHADQVDAAQAAMLAAMVQAPSAFDPRTPTENISGLNYSLLDRWVSVLQNMAGDTYPDGSPVLTQAALHKIIPDPNNHMADLKNFPKIQKAGSAARNWSGFRGYIMTAVQNELQNKYGYKLDEIGTDGLHITTTFSLRKMHALYAAVAEGKRMMRQGGQAFPMWGRIGAILENPKNGAIEAMYGGPNYTAKHCKKLDCQFNTAMVSRNQVGSSFKPYVLAAAVKQGMNVETSKLNGTSPLCVPPDNTAQNRMTLSKPKRGGCPPLWATVTPDNATKNGPVPVNAATAASSNPAFVDLAHRVGTQNIIDLAKSFGVDVGKQGSKLQSYLGETGIALGIASLTVEEQATTFATLANRGNYHTPHVIAKITRNGQSIPIKVVHSIVLTPEADRRCGLGPVVRHELELRLHGHRYQRGPEPVPSDHRQDGHDRQLAGSLVPRSASFPIFVRGRDVHARSERQGADPCDPSIGRRLDGRLRWRLACDDLADLHDQTAGHVAQADYATRSAERDRHEQVDPGEADPEEAQVQVLLRRREWQRARPWQVGRARCARARARRDRRHRTRLPRASRVQAPQGCRARALARARARAAAVSQPTQRRRPPHGRRPGMRRPISRLPARRA